MINTDIKMFLDIDVIFALFSIFTPLETVPATSISVIASREDPPLETAFSNVLSLYGDFCFGKVQDMQYRRRNTSFALSGYSSNNALIEELSGFKR